MSSVYFYFNFNGLFDTAALNGKRLHSNQFHFFQDFGEAIPDRSNKSGDGMETMFVSVYS